MNELSLQGDDRHSLRDKPDLAKALVGFWSETANVVKNANNPHFKNNYADLSAALAEVKPKLAKFKLALIQYPGVLEGNSVIIDSLLLHESGQSLSFRTEIPFGDKRTAQAIGSAITYGRRYFVMAMGGLAPVDDDGNAASSDATSEDPSTTLLPMVKNAKTLAHLEEIKAAVSSSGDQKLVEEYLAQRAKIKAKGKG